MKDVFEVQDEIAQKIAAALRIQLSPQEQEALAAKPTDNLQAYDLYLRGRSYARRLTRQDLEFALQMYENAVTQDPNFALAFAAIANACAYYHAHYAREDVWIHRARAAAERAMALQPDVPEVMDARARILVAGFYAVEGRHEDAVRETNLAMLLRPNEAMVQYNAACTFCTMNRKAEALEALSKAWRNGFKDADWARRDPDLAILRGDPEFEKLYPEKL